MWFHPDLSLPDTIGLPDALGVAHAGQEAPDTAWPFFANKRLRAKHLDLSNMMRIIIYQENVDLYGCTCSRQTSTGNYAEILEKYLVFPEHFSKTIQ